MRGQKILGSGPRTCRPSWLPWGRWLPLHWSSWAARKRQGCTGCCWPCLPWAAPQYLGYSCTRSSSLRYVEIHCEGTPGGIEFNQDESPQSTDIAPMPYGVGMTCTVSDTCITSRKNAFDRALTQPACLCLWHRPLDRHPRPGAWLGFLGNVGRSKPAGLQRVRPGATSDLAPESGRVGSGWVGLGQRRLRNLWGRNRANSMNCRQRGLCGRDGARHEGRRRRGASRRSIRRLWCRRHGRLHSAAATAAVRLFGQGSEVRDTGWAPSIYPPPTGCLACGGVIGTDQPGKPACEASSHGKQETDP